MPKETRRILEQNFEASEENTKIGERKQNKIKNK